MMRTIAALVLAGVVVAIPASGQEDDDATPRSFYRVEFEIRDGTGDTTDAARKYRILTDTEGRGVLRLSHRVPYATGSFQRPESAAASTQYQFMDVGVNIACQVSEIGSRIALTGDISMSGEVPAARKQETPNTPIRGSITANLSALLESGKRAEVAAIDDPVTSRRLAIVATATKLD